MNVIPSLILLVFVWLHFRFGVREALQDIRLDQLYYKEDQEMYLTMQTFVVYYGYVIGAIGIAKVSYELVMALT